ncbi:unnamed protein product, partial [Mesorhabditis spiculigera]
MMSFSPLLLLLIFAPFLESRKNIILILTDDQDIELGSMDFMPKTTRLLKDKGVEFTGGFVTTPICCPSRSSILTGLYVHNHNVHTNNNNCSNPIWRKLHEPYTFGAYLQKSGYKTAYFGKYLNEYTGSYVPEGWSHWMGLIRNSRFYNYTLNTNGNLKKHGFDYQLDYLTDVITNSSLKWVDEHLADSSDDPFLAVLSYPAPHGPEDPAPQFSESFENVSTHRTASWNYAPNPDKQWLLQQTGKMEPVHVAFTDILHRRRIQTLQSVDDSVHKILTSLREKKPIVKYLCQFGLIKGKNMPYEFDIRVPFFIRGPGIPRNATVRKAVANIDIAPTILAMAEVEIPDRMDGRSLLDLFQSGKGAKKDGQLAPWRDTVLVERGKMPRLRKVRDRWMTMKAVRSKDTRLAKECSSGKWSGPCSPFQAWKCYIAEDSRWRIHKCRRRRRGCPCRRREKRQIDEELIDEFLQERYVDNMAASSEWHQGIFEVEEGKLRMRRSLEECPCFGNMTNTDHPLKGFENSEEDEEFLDSTLSKKQKKRLKKQQVNIKTKNHSFRFNSCSLPQMNCFTHKASHWRTPPLWPEEYGEFCFCQNSNK